MQVVNVRVDSTLHYATRQRSFGILRRSRFWSHPAGERIRYVSFGLFGSKTPMSQRRQYGWLTQIMLALPLAG